MAQGQGCRFGYPGKEITRNLTTPTRRGCARSLVTDTTALRLRFSCFSSQGAEGQLWALVLCPFGAKTNPSPRVSETKGNLDFLNNNGCLSQTRGQVSEPTETA